MRLVLVDKGQVPKKRIRARFAVEASSGRTLAGWFFELHSVVLCRNVEMFKVVSCWSIHVLSSRVNWLIVHSGDLLQTCWQAGMD